MDGDFSSQIPKLQNGGQKLSINNSLTSTTWCQYCEGSFERLDWCFPARNCYLAKRESINSDEDTELTDIICYGSQGWEKLLVLVSCPCLKHRKCATTLLIWFEFCGNMFCKDWFLQHAWCGVVRPRSPGSSGFWIECQIFLVTYCTRTGSLPKYRLPKHLAVYLWSRDLTLFFLCLREKAVLFVELDISR